MVEPDAPIDADTCARAALDAVAKDVPIIVVPSWLTAVWLVARLSPTLEEFLLAKSCASTRRRFPELDTDEAPVSREERRA